MGKLGSPKIPCPRPKLQSCNSFNDMKDYKSRRNLGGYISWTSNPIILAHSFTSHYGKSTSTSKGVYIWRKNMWWFHKYARSFLFMLGFVGFLFFLDSFMVSIFSSLNIQNNSTHELKEEAVANINEAKPPVHMYSRLWNLAFTALAEKELKENTTVFGEKPTQLSSVWKPCADRITPENFHKTNGYIMVSANGGLNQQRVAICNGVAVASLLNATLVLPMFLYSNVWKDPSQFGDIYQEDFFMNALKQQVKIVKHLPSHLESLDIEAIGSLITDKDLIKEAKPADYYTKVLPVLQRNGVVHFIGFVNRLGFDPLPSNIQKLRCKCNFHALKFVAKIQQVGSLLIRRINKYEFPMHKLEKELLGEFISDTPSRNVIGKETQFKYLAMHMRFEVDMVAYSRCNFGGGENERKELEAYRESHFPRQAERRKDLKQISPVELRRLGKCPLTPEEAALVLAGLGLHRETYIYLAGSDIYGGKSRMQPFTSLYPNVVSKETLLTPDELAPFNNFSSQLAALDFIACATADVFAMTDSGSQLASLVSGFRVYYGDGQAPVLRPIKNRLATMFMESKTMTWNFFEDRVRKMIKGGQKASLRSFGQSIYRQPRCPECMCNFH